MKTIGIVGLGVMGASFAARLSQQGIPVIGFDKSDIVEISQKIGTYETSIQPFEDCCTVFLPKHPVIKPKIEIIERAEKKLDIESLIEEAIKNIEIVKF